MILLLPFGLGAQLPYTTVQYSYRTEPNILYGTADNYAGNPVDLYLDLYKPLADNNQHRPLLVLVHGGAWIAGSRNEPEIQQLASYFATRGYVVASVSYRLGFHPSPNGGSNTSTCTLVTPEANCVYPADSNEVIRANYRSMQDVKGAIRFLKARAVLDSVCTENVYLTGVSAGGFNALAAAFLDTVSEKPAAAGALPDAAGPSTPLAYCHDMFNASGANISRSRPDLGDIAGTIALNGKNTEVKGVANFFGGMLQNLFTDRTGEDPLLYLFHQTTDVIVNCNTAPLMSDMSYSCLDPFGFLGCAHIWNMPRGSGSCKLVQFAANASVPLTVYNAIVQNGGPNCLQNPAGHSILNPSARVNEISGFFAERIQTTEVNGCDQILQITASKNLDYQLFPNPAVENIRIRTTLEIASVVTHDVLGRIQPVHQEIQQNEVLVFTSALPSGWYTSLITLKNGTRIPVKWCHL